MQEVRPGDAEPRLRVEVLHHFRVLRDGRHVALPAGSEQLVARLVVEGRPFARPTLAALLWPDRSEHDAATQLRRALWKVNHEVHGLLEAMNRQVVLSRTIEVDLAEVERIAEAADHGSPPVSAHAVRLLEGDLLPQWSDGWLDAPRESLRQVRLHTLEALARNDLDAGRPGSALTGALAAVRLEPLRESAHRIVISAHLAEGNASEALRHYAHYRELLWAELRLRPSARLESMLTEGGNVVSLGSRRGALNA